MGSFAGTGKLIRLALRRDRVKLPVSILALMGVFVSSVAAVASMYVLESERIAYALLSASSASAALFGGPIMGSSLGSIVINETFTFFSIFVALISTLLVVRHTRQNEETGRSELIEAGAIGRYAQLTSALILAFVINIILGALMAVSYIAYNLPVEGAILAGLSMAAVGIVFAGVAAITAQLATTARGANVMAAAAVGLAFLIRGVGDMLGEVLADGLTMVSAWPTWLSPMGIARNSRPFVDDNWWVLLIMVGLYIFITALAYRLVAKRDMGAGFFAERSGRQSAKKILLSPLGLAWRLQKGLIIGWSIAVAFFAATFGALTNEIESFDSEQMSEIMATLGGSQNMSEAYLAYILMLFGVVAAAYSIQALLRVRAEESRGHLEVILSASVDKRKWLLSHLSIVVFGATVILAISGAATGLTYGISEGDIVNNVVNLAGAALVYLPAVLLFCGTTILAFSLLPSFSIAIAWLAFIATYMIAQLGPLLKLPDWLLNISPFNHLPLVPSEEMNWLPIIIMSIAAFALMLSGILLFRRRNIDTN